MINFKKIFNLDFYTSKLDQFLASYRARHPDLSASQRAEQKKYARISKMRDTPTEAKPDKFIL